MKGKKVAILVEQDYQDLEVWYPILRLREENIEVVIVGSGSSKTYKGKYGYPIQVNVDADKIKVSEYDGIIIPGGWAPDFLRRYYTQSFLDRDCYIKLCVFSGSLKRCHSSCGR